MKSLVKRLRLSQAEWKSIQERMQESQQGFSSYALSCMLNAKKKNKQNAINREFVAELAKWGNNLNQVARHLNTQKSGLDRVGLEMLKRIEGHLQAIRDKNGC